MATECLEKRHDAGWGIVAVKEYCGVVCYVQSTLVDLEALAIHSTPIACLHRRIKLLGRHGWKGAQELGRNSAPVPYTMRCEQVVGNATVRASLICLFGSISLVVGLAVVLAFQLQEAQAALEQLIGISEPGQLSRVLIRPVIVMLP